MSQSVRTYYHISEMQRALAELYALNGETVFIVPSGLDKELMLRLVAGGGSFFGARPRVRTMGEFYDEVAGLDGGRPLRVIDPPDHNLIVKYVLDNWLARMEAAQQRLPDGVRHRGFVSVVGDNIKDLLAEEISPQDMGDSLFGEEADAASPEYMLYTLYSDYLDYLAGNKLADASQIPTLARQCLSGPRAAEFVGSTEFVIVGFLSFAGGQLKLVRELGEKAKKCVFLLPECGLDDFHDAVRQINEEYKKRPDTTPKLCLLEANNEGLEYASLARELQLWIHGRSKFGALGELGDFGEVGVIVPQKGLEVFGSMLSRYGIPFNAQIRGTVAQTRVGELPRLIWGACRRGWPTRETTYLLLDPLLGCTDFDRKICAGRYPEGFESWQNTLSGHTLAVFEKLAAFCAGMAGELAPAEILARWRELLSDLDVVQNAAGFIKGDFTHDGALKDLSSCLTELDKKIGRLRDLRGDLGEAVQVTMSGDDAIRYLLDWGREATLPIPLPQSHSVTLYAGPPPTLASHKYIVITDVDYNSWPGKLRESPLLRNENKQKLNEDSKERFKAGAAVSQFHLPEMRDEREQKEGLFRRLVATGEQGAILVRSLTDEEGRPVGESQFAAGLAEEVRGRNGWEDLEDHTVRYPLAASLPGAGEVCFGTAEASLTEVKRDRGQLPRVGGAPADGGCLPSVSLSSLDEWIACPYRWWCARVLKLERSSVGLFDPAAAGSFLHRLWELAWREYAAAPKSFVVLAKKHWQEALEQEYPALCSDARLRRQAARLEKQMLAAAALQDEIENGLPPRRRLELEYALPPCEVDGVTFKGRADRIDIYDQGFVVVDYKSNKAAQHLGEYQLAAYAVILQREMGLEPLGYGWLGHADASFRGYFISNEWRDAYRAPAVRRRDGRDLAAFLSEVQDRMTEAAGSVKSGVYPALYGSDKCRLCEFFTLCRRREAPYLRQEEAEDDER